MKWLSGRIERRRAKKAAKKESQQRSNAVFNRVEEEADSIRGTAAALRLRIEERRAELGITLQEHT